MLLPLFFTCAVIFLGSQTFLGNWLSKRWLVYIGLISYPLYLWHWPILSFLHILSPQYKLNPAYFYTSRVLALILATILAILTYELMEKRLRIISRKSKYGIAVFSSLVFGVIGLGLAGKYIESHHGLPERSVAKQFKSIQMGHPAELQTCSFTLPGVEWCKILGDEAKLDLAIIGDSHALTLLNGLSDILRENGMNAVALGTGQTLGLWGVGTRVSGSLSHKGVRNLDKAFEWIVERKIPNVVLSSQGPGYSDANGFITDWPEQSSQDAAKVFEAGLRRTLVRLSEFSKVAFIIDNPVFPFDPFEFCTLRPVTFFNTKELSPCAVARSDVIRQQKTYREIVGRVSKADSRLNLIDSLEELCDEKFCFAKVGEQFFYSDNNHLTPMGIQKLAPRILDFLRNSLNHDPQRLSKSLKLP